MARRPRSKKKATDRRHDNDVFAQASDKQFSRAAKSFAHTITDGVVCGTESRGFPTPRDLSPEEIMVHAPQGVVSLWAQDVVLRWRFNEQSMTYFDDPEAAKAGVKKLFGQGLNEWGDAAPVKFVEDQDVWDFEIVMRSSDNCNSFGCVLASAFFPDAGRHELVLYPEMFEQDHTERVETMAHEIGHIFGLRHFFAQVSETAWQSELFGTHSKFSIMNYGDDSFMTDDDRSDTKRLYELAWSGELTNINGTSIKLVTPFSASVSAAAGMSAAAAKQCGHTCCCCCGNRLG